MPKKFFCYVDESGQDTKGELFIVAVVVADDEREQLREACEEIENTSHKGQRKWTKTTHRWRAAYVAQVLTHPIFRAKLNFAIYRHAQDYSVLTVQTVALALNATGEPNYHATQSNCWTIGIRSQQFRPKHKSAIPS